MSVAKSAISFIFLVANPLLAGSRSLAPDSSLHTRSVHRTRRDHPASQPTPGDSRRWATTRPPCRPGRVRARAPDRRLPGVSCRTGGRSRSRRTMSSPAALLIGIRQFGGPLGKTTLAQKGPRSNWRQSPSYPTGGDRPRPWSKKPSNLPSPIPNTRDSSPAPVDAEP